MSLEEDFQIARSKLLLKEVLRKRGLSFEKVNNPLMQKRWEYSLFPSPGQRVIFVCSPGPRCRYPRPRKNKIDRTSR